MHFIRYAKLSFLIINVLMFAFLVFFLKFSNNNNSLVFRASVADMFSKSSSIIKTYTEIHRVQDALGEYCIGDQMFVYASVLGIARTKDRKPLIDGVKTLGQIFQISYNKNDIKILRWSELRHPNRTLFEHETLQLPRTNITLRGHFRTMTFFRQVEKEIRSEFTFQPEFQKIAIEFHRNLQSAYPLMTVVGVHVYRENIHLSINKKRSVAPLSYYVKAVKLMTKLIFSRALFIVSTDDPQWCRENLIMQQEVIVLDLGPPAVHLAILAKMTHIIISTGSYGWWAAWLAKGVTVYYNINQVSPESNYFPENWIGIGK